jgi:hypothetical protein
MTELTTTRPGPKPGLKKQRPKPTRDSRLLTRSLSDFPPMLKPTLTVIKVSHPAKAYRLVWQFLGKAFLCKENQIAYARVHGKGGVMEAGETLAGILGVRFKG